MTERSFYCKLQARYFNLSYTSKSKMPSNPELKLMTELLNIDGMKVENYKFIDDIGISLYVEQEARAIPCPQCGKHTKKLHQNHRYVVRDLPLMEKSVYLQVNRRQMRCERCGKKFTEDLEAIPKKRTYTKRLRQQIGQEALEGTISKTAQKYGMGSREIETMLKDLGEELIKKKPQGLKRLGIDEIAIRKGQGNYYAVFVDIDTGNLIALLENRTEKDITEYLKTWGEEVLSQIEEVSIDLWKPYKKVASSLMPQASVVADRFHVVKQVNQELDQARKDCKRALKKQKNNAQKCRKEAAIKGSKYALLKTEKNLNKDQKYKLKEIEKEFKGLTTKHRLKEEFIEIFDQEKNWVEGLFKIGEWMEKAIKHFPESCQTIRRWIGEIIADFDRGTTQGIVEGLNNKLKLIKRKGYGFRNFSNFELKSQLSMIF